MSRRGGGGWLCGESGDVAEDSGDEGLEVLRAEGCHVERPGLDGV